MIYIFTALSFEAAPFIKLLDLKADKSLPGLRVFKADDVILCLTGTGSLKAASKASAVMGAYGFSPDDIILNFGICAGREPGLLYSINKITDSASGRDYYPDMIYKTELPERALLTVPRSVKEVEGDLLYDMEAAGIFEAASLFTAPHRMMFVKLVSDSGDKGNISRDQLIRLIGDKEGEISRLTGLLGRISSEKIKVYNEDTKLLSDLMCSEYMRSDLRKLMIYAENSGRMGEVDSFLDELRREDRLPVRSRHEGKVLLDEIRRRLI